VTRSHFDAVAFLEATQVLFAEEQRYHQVAAPVAEHDLALMDMETQSVAFL
jgi:hypothetical protein